MAPAAMRRARSPRRFLPLPALFAAALLASGCDSGSPTSAGGGATCGGYPDWQTSPFVLPYPVGTSYEVIQGNCSGFGHSGDYAYSYDFGMAIGTPVTAARAGVVSETRTGFHDGDLTPGHENFVKLQHSDGLISAYSHLSTIHVVPGQSVRAGDLVGTSGNTGETGGTPHLHFHVNTCSEPADCGTNPVTFHNTDPNPNGLLVGHVYPAYPY
jgi:murein DD-endopeptidase MepM/ murein hydrolase activator NlpD